MFSNFPDRSSLFLALNGAAFFPDVCHCAFVCCMETKNTNNNNNNNTMGRVRTVGEKQRRSRLLLPLFCILSFFSKKK
jgi:hypothetical protein